MKILIPGIQGQLGQALLEEFQSRPDQTVVGLSREQLDITAITSVQSCLDRYQPDWVINAAAYNHVDQAEGEPDKAISVNRTGPSNLARATAAKKIPLIHISTDYVFDGSSTRPYVESDTPHPISVYARSKLEGEGDVLSHNPASYVVRTAWLYSHVGKNFPLKILSLQDKPELKIVSDQLGSPTYAPHLAKKLAQLISKRPTFGLYHMANRGQTSWFDLAREIFTQLGINTPIKPILAKDYPYRAARPQFTVLSTERGPEWKLPPWEQGVADFVKNLRTHGMRTAKI